MSQNRELGNTFSAGTAGLPVAGDIFRSLLNIPSNEDFCMLVVLTSFSEGLAIGYKLWDTADINDKRIFRAQAINWESNEDLQVGQVIPFYRTGEFENFGNNGYELHTEDNTKTSWICFVQKPTPLFIIIDNGNGKGNKLGDTEVLDLVPLDSLEQFYDTPWIEGRNYFGTKITPTQTSADPYYLIDFHGFGAVAETFSKSEGGFSFEVEVDCQGKLLDFRVESST